MNRPPATDADLVAAALDGDRDAFGDLVERYQDRLFNTLVRIVGSREDAADAAQDAFVQAYSKLESFRGASQFYTWLYRIAMNVALSRRRRRRPGFGRRREGKRGRRTGGRRRRARRKRARPRTGGASPDGPRAPGRPAAEDSRLRKMEGCSYESIAEILELPVGTVRSRLFRARLQLASGCEACGARKRGS